MCSRVMLIESCISHLTKNESELQFASGITLYIMTMVPLFSHSYHELDKCLRRTVGTTGKTIQYCQMSTHCN